MQFDRKTCGWSWTDGEGRVRRRTVRWLLADDWWGCELPWGLSSLSSIEILFGKKKDFLKLSIFKNWRDFFFFIMQVQTCISKWNRKKIPRISETLLNQSLKRIFISQNFSKKKSPSRKKAHLGTFLWSWSGFSNERLREDQSTNKIIIMKLWKLIPETGSPK